jgi:hypothetical protein
MENFYAHRPIICTTLQTNGQLRFAIAYAEEQASIIFSRYAASEGITEQLEAQEPTIRARRMSEIGAR